MNVLTIGGATTDIFIQNKQISQLNFIAGTEDRSFLLFEEGSKLEIDQIDFHTGGGATNSAVSFKRLGCDVATFCKVGNDKPSEFIIQRLENSGISTQYVKQSDEYITGHSFIFPSKSGDRTVLCYRGANAHMQRQEIPQDFKEFDNLYITSLSGSSSDILLDITRKAKQHNQMVAINPGSSQLSAGAQQLYQSLANIDIFILNSEEACTFMLSMVKHDAALHRKIMQTEMTPANLHMPQLLQQPITHQTVCFDIRLFFKELLNRGPQIVVVTNGAEGVYVATEQEIIFRPSIKTNIVNTLGAGDAFGSCFVAHYAQGKTIKASMLAGIVNASSVIGHLDAKSGLLTAHELEQLCAQHEQDDTFKIVPW